MQYNYIADTCSILLLEVVDDAPQPQKARVWMFEVNNFEGASVRLICCIADEDCQVPIAKRYQESMLLVCWHDSGARQATCGSNGR